jgi:hypothetical protein
MSDGEHVRIADQASDAAGWAFRARDYAKASRLLDVARAADPSRAPLWAERAMRVHAAARQQAAKVAGPDDARPLSEVVTARLEGAGIGPGDQAVQFARAWNAERIAAAQHVESEQGSGEAQEAAQPTLADLVDAEREAGQ